MYDMDGCIYTSNQSFPSFYYLQFLSQHCQVFIYAMLGILKSTDSLDSLQPTESILSNILSPKTPIILNAKTTNQNVET